MKNIMITGANGFLGSHLVDFLIPKDCNLYALVRPDNDNRNLSRYLKTQGSNETSNQEYLGEKILIPTVLEDLEILECDIINTSLLNKIINEIKPSLIFHFAAQPYVIPSWEDPVNTIETNVIGTLNLLEPLKKNKISSKVIVACSSAEYGMTTKLDRALKETDPLLAVHPYGISKIATELLSRQYYINFGIKSVNLRFFNQTGPRKVNDACSDFVKKIAQIEIGLAKPILEVGNLKPYRDITGIRDSIQAIWLAARRGSPGESYNVCSGKKVQIQEILNIALSFSTKNIEVKDNTPRKLRKTDEDIILGDNTKIKQELGWKITQSLKDILKDMFDYWMDFFKKKLDP